VASSQISAIGIDLGTTYSAVAIVNSQGIPEIVPNSDSERLTPSVVLFEETNIIVGDIAKNAAERTPEKVVQFVKRQIMMGSSWYFPYGGQRLTALDVSAIILKKLKQDAEAQLGRSLPQAVITVPAYFDDQGRRVTQEAGQKAGLEVLDIINEPTAAAFAFGVDKSDRTETVLVYDLGGGTFDVTILRIEGRKIDVIATGGDPQLGGKDFDDALIGLAAKEFASEHGFDPTAPDRKGFEFVIAELRDQAERAKRELSRRPRASIVIHADGRTSRIDITRDQFDDAIRIKLERTLSLIRIVLKDAKLESSQIDRVLLVGGSTRVPAVRALLASFFGKPPDASVNPDEAVALGAALMAALRVVEKAPDEAPPLVKEVVDTWEITDVTSHSFGMEAFVPGTDRRVNTILIPRNSPIPVEVSKEFLTKTAGQTAIKVTIYQGEFQDPALCNPIGEFLMRGLPPSRPAGRKVRVAVACNRNGVVNVTGTDIETGIQATTEVTYRSDNNGSGSGGARWDDMTPIL
jgi:molecular chaperone DnaK